LAFRVLTLVNYSAGENPEGDSGLRFTAGLLLSLVRCDPDLHFYVIVPAKHREIWVNALSHPQITPIAMDIEPRLHGGNFQFCPAQLYQSFDFRRFDIDLLFLNQPEMATALLHFVNRLTFHNISAVSYVHWFDTRRPSSPKETLHRPALLGALSGMMVSLAVGCNSAYGRDQILEQAKHWFHEDVINTLKGRMRILPPGIDAHEIKNGQIMQGSRSQARILINHRLLKYTGVRPLLAETFPKLWSRRQDFSVLVTNPSRVRLPGEITNAPWLTIQTHTRPDYIRCLWESDIVVGSHRASHWSISTLEAICAECIPLMNRESFYPEMIEPLISQLSAAERKHVETRWFYFRSSIIRRLEELMDNLEEEREIAKRVAAHARDKYDWAELAPAWRRVFREADLAIPIVAEDNPSIHRIMDLIRRDQRISKDEILRHLKWTPKQRALSWTAFRKRLKLLVSEDASNPNAVFELHQSDLLPEKRCSNNEGAPVVEVSPKIETTRVRKSACLRSPRELE
jgi:hypothetical protein